MSYTKISQASSSYSKISVQSITYSKLTPNATTYTTPSALFPLGIMTTWNIGAFVWNTLNQNWED